jgi:hypothetical protein
MVKVAMREPHPLVRSAVSPTRTQVSRITVLAELVIASRKPLVFPIVRYETKVQSRTIDPDGTANIFVVIDSQVTDPDFQTMLTEPDLDIRGGQPHFRDGKVYGLSIHLRTWPDLMEGSPLTISFGE